MKPLPFRDVADSLSRFDQLDPVADLLGRVAVALAPPGVRRDLLSGTWLGHALHPVLTDVPIGTWMSASMLDLLGGPSARLASRRLVGLGILAALPTAASGASDLADVAGDDRRIGAAHAIGNATALALQVLSYLARRRGRWMLGSALSAAGTASIMGSAYLGGHLSLDRSIGVNRTAFERGPKRWKMVMAAGDLSNAKPTVVEANGIAIMLYRDGGQIWALSNTCSHMGGPLAKGTIAEGTVTCPWHGSRFRLNDGQIAQGPATAPQPAYEVREHDGKVELRLRARAR